MRTDFENLDADNWEEYAEFDELEYMPLWRKILLVIFAILMPIVGSIDRISF